MDFPSIPRRLSGRRETRGRVNMALATLLYHVRRITHNTSGGCNTRAWNLSLRSFRMCDGMARNVMKSCSQWPVFKGLKNELGNERRHAAISYYVSWLSSRQDLLRNEAAVAFTLAGRVHAQSADLSPGLDR